MQKQFLAQNKLIGLRLTTENDLDFVLKAEYHADNNAFVGQWTREQHQEVFSDKHRAHLIAESTEGSQVLGYLIVTGLETLNQSVCLQRIVITEKGRGYGRAALGLVKKLAFEQWQAHRLWLDVKDHNLRARHVYETEGFTAEGLLRECLKKGDHFESVIIMSILRQEYAAKEQ